MTLRRAWIGWTRAFAMILVGLCGTLGGLIAIWWVSALVLAGGASAAFAVGAGVIAALLVPLGAALWKSRGRLRACAAAMPAATLVYNAVLLTFVVVCVPDPLGVALREHGWMLSARVFGETHRATRVSSMLSSRVADTVRPIAPARPIDVDRRGRTVVADVELVGPDGTVAQPYLWDTGASYTTITRKTARAIGVEIPEGAPVVQLETAAGPREAPLVYLPAIRVGGYEVVGVAASICDACSHARTHGLVGLNVMRHFVSELQPSAGRLALRLDPNAGAADRTYDIAEFVGLTVDGAPEVLDGHVHWRIVVRNDSARTLYAVVPRVDFTGGVSLVGSAVPELAPGQTTTTRVKGRAGLTAGAKFQLRLHSARW